MSVILTTCDRPEMLQNALHSVQMQTFGDIEIIVCDDASDERTGQLVATACSEDPRVVHLRSERRLGQRSTVLRGLMGAAGEMLAVCHDDDSWEPEFLACTTKAMKEHTQVVAAFSDHWIMDEGGKIDLAATLENTRRWKRDSLSAGLHQPFTRLALVDQALPAVMATVFRSSVIPRADFPEQIGGHYDLWLAYLASRDGGAAWFLPERLTRYRVHQGSATSGGDVAMIASSIYIWGRLLQDDRLDAIHSELTPKLAGALTTLGLWLLRNGDGMEARKAFSRALRLHPSSRSAAAWALSVLPARTARALARR